MRMFMLIPESVYNSAFEGYKVYDSPNAFKDDAASLTDGQVYVVVEKVGTIAPVVTAKLGFTPTRTRQPRLDENGNPIPRKPRAKKAEVEGGKKAKNKAA